MKTRDAHLFSSFQRTLWSVAAAGLLALPGRLPAQTWTPLTNPPPNGIQMMLLLSDGTVMAQQNFNTAWYRLKPNTQGSYANGTWTTLASMSESRLYYSSAVLQDGRVFVAGGEYTSNGTRTGTNPNDEYSATAEIYNPRTDTWANVQAVPAAWSSGGGLFAFGDSMATLLPNGNVLIGPVFPNAGTHCAIYNVAGANWIDGPAYRNGANQNEASWLKLPDGSVLTIPTNSTSSQRYLPSTNQWVADGILPQGIYSSLGSEIGSAHLLPNGNGFFIGANGKTAIYTPTGDETPGTWTAGPALPDVLRDELDDNGNVTSTTMVPGAAPDAVAAMMPNGRILVALSGTLYNDPRAGTDISTYWKNRSNPLYPTPTSFFEYDPLTNAFTSVSGPTGATESMPAYQAIMLVLPDGSVLYSNNTAALYTYRSSGAPLAAGKPVITGISTNPDGTYHLTGTGLNGISFGASFGDDAQMDTNYPLVRLTAGNGNIIYARTFDWSSNGVRTGNTPVSTEFSVPTSIFRFAYSLVVVANGISSDPVTFNGPIWVDVNATASLQLGSRSFPYHTLAQGVADVATGGTIIMQGPGSSPGATTLSKAMTIVAVGGSSTIGQ